MSDTVGSHGFVKTIQKDSPHSYTVYLCTECGRGATTENKLSELECRQV